MIPCQQLNFYNCHLPDNGYWLNFKLLIINHEQVEVKDIFGKPGQK
jgi:hypothetical protein